MKIFICITFLCCCIARIDGTCKIRNRFRGRFQLLEGNDLIENGQLAVRRNSIMVTQNGQEKSFKCIDMDVHTFLLESNDRSGVLCLSFADMADTSYEFVLGRQSMATSDGMFVTAPRVAGASVENSCDNYEGPTVSLRRTRPGCDFPPILRKEWKYKGEFIKAMTFTTNTLVVTFQDGTTLDLTCERIDKEDQGYNVAMRATAITPKRDGVMCLYFRPNSAYGKLQTVVKRLNNGNTKHNLVKEIYRYEPIYLHTTCDLIDTPVDAGILA